MRIKISTKLVLVMLLTSLIPLSIVGFVGYSSNKNITQIAGNANQQVAELAMSNSTEALSQELKTHLESLGGSVASDIDEILMRVEADTGQLADFAAFLYNHPQAFGRYPYPNVYKADPDRRMFGSVEQNQNSWMAIFRKGTNEKGEVSPEVMGEIYLTEFLDPKFKSVARNNPYAVQLYLNTKSQMTRGMPFVDGQYLWVNAVEQFESGDDVTSYDFYYLADEAHDPARKPVWTELYWDPAGLGWMVSSIAPVYRDQELMGVAGIDITLGKMIDQIINVQIQQTGFAFLMSHSGQAIAFPERGAEFLGFKGGLEGDFGNNEQFSFFLTEANDAEFQAIIAKMQAGEHDLTTYTLPSTGREYFFTYHPVSLTGWGVGLVVPVEEVIAPAARTNAQIQQSMEATSHDIAQRSNGLMTTFGVILGLIGLIIFPVALVFSRTISNPIKTLDEGSRKVGAGELGHRITIKSGDEIEGLATTFNQMAADLEAKVDEIEAANAKLRKLDELKSQFISMASHELRTPLIAIQGYIDLLRDSKVKEFGQEQRKMLDTVSRNATRLARIVSELLDISRIEENKLVLRQEPLCLSDIVKEVTDEQKPSLDKRRHTLTLNIEPHLPQVMGDRDRLAQVIINLLGNAIKYTPDGGHIQIKAIANNDCVQLSVIDNGIGIKAEHIGQLFKRFSTVGDVTKHRTSKEDFMAGGTGLGLSIVEGIIKAHGGTVWVESQYGQGSTFHLTLPIANPTALSQMSETASAMEPPKIYKATQFDNGSETTAIKNQGRLKILAIDDEDDALAITQEMLTGHYEVISIKTSATGLKEALTNKPDLILLDAWMPGISGYDVCKTLKRNSKTKEVPIIFCTAAAQNMDEDRAREAGADGFVSKPFKKDTLVSLIESFRGHKDKL
ncbi:MAG: ATP-binding protein [Anaerolineae bacterium]